MKELKNKVIIVTGAASGIGRELVIQLVQEGAKVAALDINVDNLAQTIQLANGKENQVSSHIVDMANTTDVNKLPEEVVAIFGKIDGVINNAGIIQPMVKFEKLDSAICKKIFDINTFGVFNLTRSALPYIHKSNQGFIVNVSSMGGFLPVPGQAIYGATKAAVKLFTEGLYAELRDTNVSVSVVFPGAIDTNIASNSGLDLSGSSDMKVKTTSAPDAAKIIIKGMKKGKLRIFVGKDAKMMDKLYRFFPVFAVNMMQKMLAGILES